MIDFNDLNTLEEAQTEINRLKNKFRLTWMFEYDLPSAGGVLWYKPNGECFALTDQNIHAAEQLYKAIVKEGIEPPAFAAPLERTILLQGNPNPGIPGNLPEEMELEYESMIPTGNHPGAFGVKRKNHIHEGVDLYAPHGAHVRNMRHGTVVNIIEDFTGPGCGMPWWNKTSALVVEDAEGVWIYGEITIANGIKVGDVLAPGHHIGFIEQVLKVDKGRPMAMLHLERYTKGTTDSVGLWKLDMDQPDNLLDPTPLLLEGMNLVKN